MSDPKQVHIQGDVDISVGLDSSLGNGYLYVTSATGGLDVQGTTDLDQTTIVTNDGLFSVSGTNKISFTPTAEVEIQATGTSFFQTSTGNITVNAQTGTLNNFGNAVAITADTTTATMSGATGVTVTSLANAIQVNASTNFEVDAGSAILMDALASSNFTVTGNGQLLLKTTAGRAILEGGSSGVNAVTIATTDAAGGVDIDAGTGGFDVLVTSGPFSIDAQNAASNLSLATNANAQDLTIALTGVSDSSLILSSSGTAADAFKITSGNGSTGGIDMDAGSSGIAADTTGPISLGATGTSDFTVTGAFDLSLISTAGKTIINAGSSTVDAITLTTTDAAGGIDINAGTNGITIDTTAGFSIDSVTTSNITLTGTDPLTVNNTLGQLVLQSGKTASADAVKITSSSGMDIDAGTTGLTMDSAGSISIDAIGVSSNFTLNTNSSGQNLTLSLTGPSANNELIISSNGDGNASINIDSVNGGIDIDAVKKISLDTTDAVNGITIGTAGSLIPITIGSSTSLTTIAGDLLVSGTTTTVNTETLNVADNIILINSAGGELGNDGGMVIRRNQAPTNAGAGGDVSGDVAQVTSSFGIHTATSTTTWSISSSTEITITTVDSGFVFAVGMVLSGAITGSGTTTIVSFSSGTGGAGSVAVVSATQTPGAGVGTLTGTVTHNTSGGSVSTASLYTISGTTNLTLTTVATGVFKVGMKITGTGIVGTPVIASFSSGSGASGSVAVLTVAQTNVAGSTNTLTGTYGDTTRVVLNSAASAVDDFYNGWWIKITSGPGINQIRRIKDYIGNIKTAILYTTFDNIDAFVDGLDLVTPPLATNTYSLYNSPYVASFYDESADKWILAYSSVSPDPIAAPGPSTIIIQKYVAFDSGAITIQDNGTPGNSVLNVNVINEFTSDIGVTIEGVNLNNGLINGAALDNTEIVELGVQSTVSVAVAATDVHGSFFILVDAVQSNSGPSSYLRLAQGAFACFAIASSNIGGGAVNRLASSKGVGNERIDGTWAQGELFKIQHKPARNSGSGNLFYRVKTSRVITT